MIISNFLQDSFRKDDIERRKTKAHVAKCMHIFQSFCIVEVVALCVFSRHRGNTLNEIFKHFGNSCTLPLLS